MILERWFSLPIWYDYLGTEVDFAALASKCLEIEQEGYPSRTKSNVGGWQSSDVNLQEFPDFWQLLSVVSGRIDDVCRQISSDFQVEYDNSWININRKGDTNMVHVHPTSALSACVYLQTPEDCGNIVFQGNEILDHYLLTTDSELFFTETTYKPEVGKLLVFPSCMKHGVNANNSEEPRISIAFNFLRKY